MKILVLIIISALLMAAEAGAKIRVITSTADLAYFAHEVGGELVEVESIASAKADVHFIEVRPSHIIKVSKADVVLKVGLELDMWMDQLIDGSRNSDLRIIDCSEYVEPMEVPSFKPDARHGDLHRFGNPHYWLGPQNVPAIVQAVVEGLAAAEPEQARVFEANAQRFLSDLETGLSGLSSKVDRLRGASVVFYHNSWPYFNEYVAIMAVGFVEPYPGVPPSPSHIKELSRQIREKGIKVIAIEPYFDDRVPQKIAAGSEAQVVTLYPSIGGRKEGETYVQWFEGNLDALLGALP